MFTAIRCAVEQYALMPLSAPFIAGGVAVAIPTMLDKNRQDFLHAYFKENAGQSMKKASIVMASAISGAVVLGCGDLLIRYIFSDKDEQ